MRRKLNPYYVTSKKKHNKHTWNCGAEKGKIDESHPRDTFESSRNSSAFSYQDLRRVRMRCSFVGVSLCNVFFVQSELPPCYRFSASCDLHKYRGNVLIIYTTRSAHRSTIGIF